jgi:tetratricopeptide (TPR) repeat protein
MATDFQKLHRIPRQFARWQNAQQQLVKGRPSLALASYHDLVQRFPGVAQLWFELGIAEMGALNFTLAERAFHHAGELAPRDASLLVLLGQQFHRLRRLDQARECFKRAITADPSSVHARLSLAAWLERERHLDAAWECVESCLAQHPKDSQALCVRALLLHRQRRNEEAETVLRDLLRAGPFEPRVSYSIRHLLAVVLDAVGQYPEALQCLCEAKAQARRVANTTRMEQDYDRADRYRRELLAELTGETIQRWRAEGSRSATLRPLAFLGGHPRSGTTLLEQILDAHPNLLAFDESEAFSQEIWHQLAPMQETHALDLKRLNGLTSARRAELCDRYLKSLLRESPAPSNARVWLDKNPSPTAALHLWLRLFPASKVIIALRDPRDIIVSCFFQNLALTPTNANFLSLERTVKHYADLMDVWLRLRELGGFDWLETRYEDLVENMENEGRRVTAFLGLKWDPVQARFHEVAASKFVFSPTYNDATQSVHSRSVGRWRHYAEALAPFEQHFRPYCRAFGYSAE